MDDLGEASAALYNQSRCQTAGSLDALSKGSNVLECGDKRVKGVRWTLDRAGRDAVEASTKIDDLMDLDGRRRRCRRIVLFLGRAFQAIGE